MEQKKKLYLIQVFIVFLLCLGNFHADAEGKVNLQQTDVAFSKKTLTLKDALDELNNQPGISVIYGNIDKYLKLKITFSSTKLSIAKAIDEIKNAAPVEIIFNDNHIIVKERKLNETYLLKGTVKDASTGERLSAANVYLVALGNGVVTDANGVFIMKLAPGSYRLACRFVGYVEQIIPIDFYGDATVDFSMEVKENEINQVNIAGSYSELEVLEKGRPIETIDSKTIERLNTNDVNDALHGRLNGVWSTKVSGAPGDHHRIRIRGINSIFGSSDPLYVVDGSIIPIVNFDNIGIADLNSHDVEKITILKDAASTALYGNMGSNGVILIETKKGGGATQFKLGVKQGVQTFSKRYDLMGAETFLNTLQLNDNINKTDFYKVIPQIHYEEYPTYYDSLGNALVENDFQDELFRTGLISEYQLSGTGQLKTIDYYFSGGYYNHKGVITNSNYNKYMLTLNLSKVIKDRMSVRLLYKGSHQENKNTLDNYLGNDVIFKGINYEPAYYATPDSFLRKKDRMYYNDVTNASVATLANHTLSPDKLFNERNKIIELGILPIQY